MATVWQYNGNMTKEHNDEERTNVRVSRDLLNKVRLLAQADTRSLNGEIVVALREFVERHMAEQSAKQAS